MKLSAQLTKAEVKRLREAAELATRGKYTPEQLAERDRRCVDVCEEIVPKILDEQDESN